VNAQDLTFALLAANPFGGLLIAVPFSVLELHYPAWLAIALGAALAYLQVPAIDLAWTTLSRIPWFCRFLERRRSPRVERLLAARGAFWVTFLATPFLGPWVVMAFMRYAHVRQRRVALPILSALACTAGVVAALSELAPRAFGLSP